MLTIKVYCPLCGKILPAQQITEHVEIDHMVPGELEPEDY
ncbi:hypothetical protein ES703_72173 [subsurface metagenome]